MAPGQPTSQEGLDVVMRGLSSHHTNQRPTSSREQRMPLLGLFFLSPFHLHSMGRKEGVECSSEPLYYCAQVQCTIVHRCGVVWCTGAVWLGAPVQCGVVHRCSEVPPEVAPEALYRRIRHFDTTLKEPSAATESLMAKTHS